jgi:hypothetical protein
MTTASRVGFAPTRRTLVGFVAGLAVAGAVALGINVATSNDSSTKPAVTNTVKLSPVVSDRGCRVMHGPC